MDLGEMHDDEVRARLGLAPVNRPATMEERIEANMVRAMPEPHESDHLDSDVATDAAGEILATEDWP
jgi:hypothetical protein